MIKQRREEDKHWLVRTYRHYEPYIQVWGLFSAILIGGSTLYALSQKAMAFDSRISTLEQSQVTVAKDLGLLNQKTDLMLEFWRIPNPARGQ